MKRRRSEVSSSSPSWWSRISEEFVSKGGIVHDSLDFDEDTRELRISSEDATIQPDTTLFKIPIACMMTRDRALDMCPWLDGTKDFKKRSEGQHTSKDTQQRSFYNDPTDVMIALAMASQSPESLSYLQSLPSPASFDALPRRWSDDKVQQLLQNTSIFDRVFQAKMGTREDYEKAKRLHEAHPNGNNSAPTFPSFEKFSDMLATMTSRAFQLGDTAQDVALVPLLDLSNHARGKGEKKNVTYEVDARNPFMLVKAATAIRPGECLRLTYGAQGNAQLLLNYGFCIPQNIEPDGSSNDVLELEVGDDTPNKISLRAGPKSYSYGGFKAGLDAFRPKRSSSNIYGGAEEDPNEGFECFLNQMGGADGEEDDDEDGLDNLYESGYAGSPGRGDDFERIDSDSSNDDKQALTNFQKALLQKYGSYSYKGESLKAALARETCPEKFTAILCHSEQRTIFFFLKAVSKVLSELKSNVSISSINLEINLPQDDLDLINQQTTQLADAYMAIRDAF